MEVISKLLQHHTYTGMNPGKTFFTHIFRIKTGPSQKGKVQEKIIPQVVEGKVTGERNLKTIKLMSMPRNNAKAIKKRSFLSSTDDGEITKFIKIV